MTSQSSPTRLVRLSAVPAIVERISGERPHISTVHRWRQRGCHGVRLRTQFLGGSRRTCELWLREFFEAVTAAAEGEGQAPIAAPPTRAKTSSARLQHEQAERELAAAGI